MEEFLYKMDSFFEFLMKCGITVPAIFLIVPIYIALFILCFTYRKSVILLAKHRWFGNPDLREPLDLCSALLSLFESPFKFSPSMVMVPMVVAKGIPDTHKIKEIWRARLFRKKDKNGEPFYPELLQTLDYFMGCPFWKRIPGMTEDKVLDEYFGVLRRIGGWDPMSLVDFLKTFSTKQFKRGEPLWEMAILEGYTVPGSTDPHFVLVGRFQHTITDGAGCLHMLQNLGSNPPQEFEKMKPPIPLKYYIHTFFSPLYRGIYDLVSLGFNLVVFTNPDSVWPKLDPPSNSEGITREFSLALSLSTPNSTLTTVKKVSKAWGVSGTSVILTAILRSLRKTVFAAQIVLPTYVHALIPLASPEHTGRLTNKILATGPHLHLYDENPAIQGKWVDKGFQTAKNSSLPYTLELFQNLGGMLPQLGKEPDPDKSEFVCVTTLIGPKNLPTICGYQAEAMSCLLPISNDQRYPCFHLISVADKLYLTLIANKSLIEDDGLARKIVNGFHHEIARFEKHSTP